jgi:hypothetical protein
MTSTRARIVTNDEGEGKKLGSPTVGSATERTIALLKERCAALIAAAVTGAIKLGAEP